MKLVDKLLSKIGLMRKSEHEVIQDSWKYYTEQLGKAAKEKGVNVLFDDSSLIGIKIDTDVFVLGSRNYIHNCDFTSGKVLISPKTTNNFLSNNRFINSEGNEKGDRTIFGNTVTGEITIGKV